MQENRECPINCPNRASNLGKGYSCLIVVFLTIVLVYFSCSIKVSRSEGLQIETKEPSLWVLAGYAFLAAGVLKLNTDPIAEMLGRIASIKIGGETRQ
jgi:hypothetical protein